MSSQENTKICPNFDMRSTSSHHHFLMNDLAARPKFKPGTIPSKKVKCPECGRRVKQRIIFCHDGCCVIYVMPRHKRRGWQKMNKTHSRDNRLTKRKNMDNTSNSKQPSGDALQICIQRHVQKSIEAVKRIPRNQRTIISKHELNSKGQR